MDKGKGYEIIRGKVGIITVTLFLYQGSVTVVENYGEFIKDLEPWTVTGKIPHIKPGTFDDFIKQCEKSKYLTPDLLDQIIQMYLPETSRLLM